MALPIQDPRPCDWRVSLNPERCVDSSLFIGIQYLAIVIVGLALLAVTATLFVRLYEKFTNIWQGFGATEALLLFMMFHFIGRVATHAVLLKDVAPSTTFRSLLWEIPWLLGLTGMQLYVAALAGVTSASSELMRDHDSTARRLPKKATIYTVIMGQLILQACTNVPLAYLAGRYDYPEDKWDNKWHPYHSAHYSLWAVYLGLLSLYFGYFSTTLLRALKGTVEDRRGSTTGTETILNTRNQKLGMEERKLRIQCMCLSFIFGWFGVILFVFAWARKLMLTWLPFSIILTVAWDTLVPVIMLIFCAVTLGADYQSTESEKGGTTGGGTLSIKEEQRSPPMHQ
ncbi:hypothetical protein DFJ77DRAFT_441390 [Powellomyces hirtus]|nr:hypothetical protein DFJ77DRAFT_441390 [Powellomyces hirtus]